MGRVRRRRFLIASGALIVAPLAVAQQPGRTYRIGVFFDAGSSEMPPHREAVRERLGRHGFVEGRNLQMIWRGSSGARNDDRETARELVAARPDAILAFSTAMTQAVQWATKSVPIVFTNVSDPIADGVVKDYARPGGNATGVSVRHRELLLKRMELLRELAPGATRAAIVTPYATDPSLEAALPFVRRAAIQLNFELIEVTHRLVGQVEEKHAEAIVVYSVQGARLTADYVIGLAAKLRIAAIFPDAESVARGGLASYGTDPLEDTRLGADQLARVLKGANPGELAVDQSSRFILAINLKTARALGITIPQAVLLRADEVIE
jgi:putative ABC transport system substrate-binding protein